MGIVEREIVMVAMVAMVVMAVVAEVALGETRGLSILPWYLMAV